METIFTKSAKLAVELLRNKEDRKRNQNVTSETQKFEQHKNMSASCGLVKQSRNIATSHNVEVRELTTTEVKLYLVYSVRQHIQNLPTEGTHKGSLKI